LRKSEETSGGSLFEGCKDFSKEQAAGAEAVDGDDLPNVAAK
jgi:hypothetical protein